MLKPTLALTTLTLATLGFQRESDGPSLPFEEQTMIIEYLVATDEAVVKIDAEGGSRLERIEVRDPSGRAVLKLGVPEAPGRGVSGILIETLETPANAVFKDYPEGAYDLRGRTMDGRQMRGAVTLSHDLLPAPVVLFPHEGAVGVPVSFVARWSLDPKAEGYVVEFEQDENDGLVVELPAGTSSFLVPPGVLAPGKASHFEVGAVGPNGNITLVETQFVTR